MSFWDEIDQAVKELQSPPEPAFSSPSPSRREMVARYEPSPEDYFGPGQYGTLREIRDFDGPSLAEMVTKPSFFNQDPLEERRRQLRMGKFPSELEDFEPDPFNPDPLNPNSAYAFNEARRKAARMRIAKIEDFESITPEKISAQALLGLRRGMEVDIPRQIAGVGMAFGNKASREAAEGARLIGQEYADLSSGVGGEMAGEAANLISGTSLSMLPAIPAAIIGGPALGGLVAGAQSFGGTFSDAADYFSKNLDRDDAEKMALAPALLSGLATMLTTRAFGHTGIEGAFARNAEKAPRSFLNLVQKTLGESASEGVEEAVDQIWQSLIAKKTYNPDMTLEDAVRDVVAAGAAGGLLGGASNIAAGGISTAGESFRAGRRLNRLQELRRSPERREAVPYVPLMREVNRLNRTGFNRNKPGASSRQTMTDDEFFASINGGPAVANTATVPQPNWRVAVQAPQGEVPGYVQIINPDGTEQDQSPTMESLRAAGVEVPDFTKLPTGSYTYEQATKKLEELQNPPEKDSSFGGLDLKVEKPKGSIRSGKDKSGNEWSVTMPAAYGRIKRTEGADGEHIDFYMGEDKKSKRVFIVDQINPETGKFDEHKTMLGFSSPEEAVAAYDAAFSDGKGPQRRGAVTEMSLDNFKVWLKGADKKKAFAYTEPKVDTTTADGQNKFISDAVKANTPSLNDANKSETEKTGPVPFEIKPQPPIVDLIDHKVLVPETTGRGGKGGKSVKLPGYQEITDPEDETQIRDAVRGFSVDNTVKKSITRNVIFLENDETGQVVGLPIWETRVRGQQIRVGALPNKKTGGLLIDLMKDGWNPIASVRLKTSVDGVKDPNAKWIYADYKDFEQQVKIPAMRGRNQVASNLEALQAKAVTKSVNSETGEEFETQTPDQIEAAKKLAENEESLDRMSNEDTESSSDGSVTYTFGNDPLEKYVLDELPKKNGKPDVAAISDEVKRMKALQKAIKNNPSEFRELVGKAISDLVANVEGFADLDAQERFDRVAQLVATQIYEKFDNQNSVRGSDVSKAGERGNGKANNLPQTVRAKIADVASGQPGLIASNAVITAPPIRGIKLPAHHGTPHKVDRFSTSKIGTGEGAQVYGWGLYFAENPEVARSYQKGLTEKDFIRKVREVYNEFSTPEEASEELKKADLNEGQRNLLKALEKEDWWGFDFPHQAVQAALREPENFDPSPEVLDALKTFGNHYTVDLNVSDDELLDWDKPLSEQSENVKKNASKYFDAFVDENVRQAKEAGVQFPNRQYFYENTFPSVFYDWLAKDRSTAGSKHPEWMAGMGINSPRHASELLSSIGIKGIKYLDQESRPGANEGPKTYNYVIFDASRIRITHENGKPVSVRNAIASQARGSASGAAAEWHNFLQTDQNGDVDSTIALNESARMLESLAAKIEDREESDQLRAIALIGRQLTENPVETRVRIMPGKNKNAGLYVSDDDIAYIWPDVHNSPVDVVRTIIHEDVHSKSMHLLDAYEGGETDGMTEQQVQAIIDLNQLFQAAKRARPNSKHYGLTNLHEFVSEMMSEPEFMRDMNSIRSPLNPKFSIWKMFKAAIKFLLRLDNKFDNSIFNDAFDRIMDLSKSFDKHQKEAMSLLTEMSARAKPADITEALAAVPTLGQENLDRVTARESVAQTNVVKNQVNELRSTIEQVEGLGKMATREDKFNRRVATRVLGDKSIKHLTSAISEIENLVQQTGQSAADWFVMTQDARYKDNNDLLSNVAMGVVESVDKVRSRSADLNRNFDTNLSAMNAQLLALIEKKTEFRGKAAVNRAVMEEYRELIQAGMATAPDRAVMLAYKNAARNQSGAAGLFDFLLSNKINPDDLVNEMQGVPANIIPVLKAKTGINDLPDLLQKVKASEEALRVAAELLIQSDAFRSVLAEAQEILDKPAEHAEEEFYEKLQAAIRDGKTDKAIKLLVQGVYKEGADRKKNLNKGTFFARAEQRLAVRIEAMKKVRDVLNKIITDPEFQHLEQQAYAQINVREVLFGTDGKKLVLKPIPGQHKGFTLDLDSTTSAATGNLKALEEYNVAAKAYLLLKDSPDYNEATANAIRAWLKQSDVWLNSGLLPESGMILQNKMVGLSQMLTSFWDGYSLTPDLAVSRVAGVAGQYLTDTLNAYKTGQKVVMEIFRHREAELTRKMVAAIKAHKMSPEDYRIFVWNPLLQSHQNYENSGKLEAGDKTAYGHEITAADIALMDAVRAYEKSVVSKVFGMPGAHSSLQSNAKGIITELNGRTVLRNQVATGTNTAPRSIAKIISWMGRWKQGNESSRKSFLDKHSVDLLFGYIKGSTENSFKFGYKFRNELKSVYNAHVSGENPMPFGEGAVDWLTSRIIEEYEPENEREDDDAVPPTAGDVESQIISEMDALLDRAEKETIENPRSVASVIGGRTSTNTERGYQVFPGLWYDYASITSGEHVGYLISALNDLAINHLKAVDTVIAELKRKVDDFKDGTAKEGKDEFYTAGAVHAALKSMEQYRNWINKAAADHQSHMKRDVRFELNNLDGLGRSLTGYMTGSLLATPGPVVNNFFGGMLGVAMYRSIYGRHGLAGNLIRTGWDLASAFIRDLPREVAFAMTKPGARDVIGKYMRPALEYLDGVVAQHRDAQDAGINSTVVLSQNLVSMFESAAMGGTAGDIPAGRAGRILKGSTAFVRGATQAIGHFTTGRVDWMINSVSPQLASEMELDLMIRAKRFGQAMIDRAQSEGYDPFNPGDKRNRFGDKELTGGGVFKNLDAGLRSSHLREFLLKQAGINIDAAMLDYLRRSQQDPAARLFTPEQMKQITFAIASDVNMSNYGNRPVSFRSSKSMQLISLFMGYNAWRMFKVMSYLAGNRRSDRSVLKGKLEALPIATSVLIATAIIGSVGAGAYDLLRRWLLNRHASLPTPVDLASGKLTPAESAMVIVRSTGIQLPLIGTALAVFDGTTHRTGYDLNSQFVLLNAATDLMKTVKESWQSKDPVLPAVKFASRWTFPSNWLARYFPNMQGLVEMSGVRADLARGARNSGMESRLPKSPSFADIQYTPESPILNRFINAVGKDDLEEASAAIEELYQYQIEKKGMNEKDAREAVNRKLQSRNPATQVFGSKPTDEELETVLSKLPDADAARARRVFSTFNDAVSAFTGKQVTFTARPKRPAVARISSRLLPRSSASGGSRLTRRVNYAPSRLTRVPRGTARRTASRLSSRSTRRRSTYRNPRLRAPSRRRLSRRRRTGSRLV